MFLDKVIEFTARALGRVKSPTGKREPILPDAPSPASATPTTTSTVTLPSSVTPVTQQAAKEEPPMTPELSIYIEPTPNPTAFKFILSQDVKRNGKIGFKSETECKDIPLAHALFQIEGVKDVHFFENVITVTFSGYVKLSEKMEEVKKAVHELLPAHNADFSTGVNEEQRRKTLSPELQQIEEILDSTIRPGLRGDGGDIEVLNLDGNNLFVRYQGACGSCPSSTTGTLMAIQGILRERFHPEVDVISL